MTPARLAGALALAALCALAAPAARAAEVSGIVFDDRNGDGLLRSGEPGLSGRVVYVDDDLDGVLDNRAAADTCDGSASEPCAVTGAGGAWRLSGLPGGGYQVRVVAQPGWQATTPQAVDVLLISDETIVADVVFGQFRLGVVTGVVFADADGDGARGFSEAALSGWTVFADADLDGEIDAGEAAAYSDAAGAYTLGGLTPATYAVRLRPRCGFRQTLPPPPGRYALTITSSGQVIEGRDFGTQSPAVLPGDGNGDGAINAADMVAVTGQLYGVAPAIGRTDANEDGRVTFADLGATAGNAFDCSAFTTAPIGVLPTPTATASPTLAGPTATATASPTLGGPTATASPTLAVPTVTATATASLGATATATASFGASATATATQSVAPATATATRTAPGTATASRTATASTTPSPTVAATPSRTPTTSSAPADALAGTAVQVANGLSAIPAVITALVSGLEFGEALAFAPAGETSGAGGNCPLGGTATRTCGGAGVGRTMSLAFDACEVSTAAGSVVIDELPPAAQAVTLSGSLVCPIPLPPWTTAIALQAVFRSPQDALQLTARASLTGTVQPQLDLNSACRATGATLTLDGTIRSTFADGSPVGLTFDGTVIKVDIAAFNAQCVPINYTMTLNGPATLATGALAATLGAGGAADDAVDVVFDDFVVAQNATGTPTLTTLAGDLGVACANSTLTFETLQALTQAVGEPCPQAGVLRVTAGSQQTRLLYRAGGGVGLDVDNDGVSEKEIDSCQDAPLLCAEPEVGTPTASPTRSATPIATSTRTATATATRTVTATVTPLISSTPTATGQATATASRTASATATGTRTATASPSPTVTGTPNPVPQTFCTLSGPAPIPDGNADGVNNTIVVPPTSQIVTDLNVTLDIAHTYVGDLRVTLTHVESGRSIVLLDRPGLPGLEFGCQLNDIDATFDDAALRPAEDRCLEGPPWAAIDSSLQPAQPLATFGGDNLAGTWRLNVADFATQDTGTLLGWCLETNSRSPVVTDFTCTGQDFCVLVVDEPFSLNFAYVDPDGDAASWEMHGVPEGGSEFLAGSGPIALGGSGSFVVDFQPFTCPSGDCVDSTFDYFVTVRDQQGRDSVAQRIRIIVSLFGG